MEPPSVNGGFFDSLAETFGTTAPAVRLLISILLGYPLAVFYRTQIYSRSPEAQHIFFILTGLSICYLNFGRDIIHLIACVLILYLILILKGGTLLSVLFAFLSLVGYLIVGYYITETDTYDIKWTMPHCVLTLRALGLVFDVYDGKRPPEQLSVDQKLNALTEIPSLLEIFGCCFFFGGCLVGPQYSMKRYLNFVNKTLIPRPGRPDSIRASLTRGFVGILYLLIFVYASSIIPIDYVLTDSFKSHMLFTKYLVLGLWGKIHCMKYIVSWMLSESTCMMTGITYNGYDSTNYERWDAFSNINITKFETVTKFGHVIDSFNIQTNKWAAMYIYKRLKCLGSKSLSQLITLAFLAVWHGLHLTYYLVFALEFVVMKFEHDVDAIVSNRPTLCTYMSASPFREIKLVLQKLYLFVFMGYCLLPFIIISWEKTNEVYGELYYLGHFLYFGWFLLSPCIKRLVPFHERQGTAFENGYPADKTN